MPSGAIFASIGGQLSVDATPFCGVNSCLGDDPIDDSVEDVSLLLLPPPPPLLLLSPLLLRSMEELLELECDSDRVWRGAGSMVGCMRAGVGVPQASQLSSAVLGAVRDLDGVELGEVWFILERLVASAERRRPACGDSRMP
jgi:hypothetical protein